MRVAILTQYYPPEHGAPQNRLSDLARRWVRKGVEVEVLTAMPNYPKGKVFDDYRGKFMHCEEIDGVRVIRSWIFETGGRKGTIRQLASYLSFAATSKIPGLFKMRRPDFIICESPPLFLGATALFLKYLRGARLVMNISDLWPESAVQLGMIGPGPALWSLERFEWLLYRESALVSCQTEGIVKGVRMRCPSARTLLFPNGVDLDMFPRLQKDDALRESLGLGKGKFIIGYGGNHGRSQALTQVLDAARILLERGESGIHFALFGDGPEKAALQERAATMALPNVSLHPSQPREAMAKTQALWDAAVVPLKDISLFDGARPSKMFELMAGGIPFIFCGKGEGAELAVESGCSVAVPPESPERLADAAVRMAAMDAASRETMGATGREFVESRFNRERLAEDFLKELEGILK